MPYVYDKAASAEKYKAKENDTLQSVAAKYAHIKDWKVLALFNFGTDVPREVNRALVETMGCSKIDAADPGKTVLKPHPDLTAEILIPKPWKKDGLALNKQHKIKLKPLRPATAVSIKILDKWFIPGAENCDIKYELEGAKDCADKVAVEVYGSNYCKCTDWNESRGTYEALPDVPVFKQTEGNPADERKEHALEVAGGDGKKQGWKGEANATDGILSVKTGDQARHLNVAFSPYTVHLRYFKDDADNKARLVMQPFWPRWDEEKKEPAVTTAVEPTQIKVKWSNDAEVERGVLEIFDRNNQRVHLATLTQPLRAKGARELIWNKQYRPDTENSKFGRDYLDDAATAAPKNAPYTYKVTTFICKPVADSLKIKWEIKDTDKLERGQLLVIDGRGLLVFRAPLPTAKLAKDQQHEQAWDGKLLAEVKNSKGGVEVIPQDMPYRVQVQAHTGANVDKGVAIAAMHTEVRLYVHPATLAPSDLAYDAWFPQQSMMLGLGPLAPGDPPDKGGTTWYQYKLAESGFHPGPVSGQSNDAYKLAMKEFKRSVPKHKTGADYERLTIDENEDADTEAALEHMEARYKRKWFGSLTRVLGNNDAPDLSDAEINSLLPNPGQDVVVWVDDRQYYTAGDARDDSNNPFLTGTPAATAFGLANYRGAMDIADNKAQRDAESIARPWIPLKAEFRVVSKTKGLYDAAAPSVDEKTRAFMQRAIGPLRVDWTFDELPRDVSVVDTTAYDHTVTRSRRYVDWALAGNKATHVRKDTKRPALYTNCLGGADPADAASAGNLGGIRPADPANYYKQAFGYDEDHSLFPWIASAVSETESIATVVHDHMQPGQTDKLDLFPGLVGASGIYFNPSRVAGDGYRVRAEVQFKKFAEYEFPNLDALAARYPVSPQAHTARLRVWRRSSIRGYMCWSGAATGHWPGLLAGLRAHYRAAHVYFVHEGAAVPNTFNVADVYDPANAAHQTSYKNTITNNLGADPTLKDITRMQLRGTDIWPWGHRNDLGWPWLSPMGILRRDLYGRWLNSIISQTWRKFRDGLLLALVKNIEKKGILRGHLLVEFDSSPAMRAERYQCDSDPSHFYWAIQLDGAAGRPDEPCPTGCGGTLSAQGGGRSYAGGMPLPAVGIALGATWLFTSSDADTWAHEIGHHRHLEHAASAPGAQYAPRQPADPVPNAELHDSADNTTQNWVAMGSTASSEQDWDRNCVMSYSASNYPGGRDYFCGKCLLRNRGWKVQSLGYPAADVAEPAP